MERYLRRNRLSEWMDGLGCCALMYLLAAGWFTWLWGLNVPTLLAGAALGTLLCTARREWRKRTVHRREKALRSRLGAELMLEDMLMAEPKEAHFRAALLLAEKWPITLQSVKEEGVLCSQEEETLLVQCIRMPADGELSASDLLAAQRAVRRAKADRAILCPLGKASPKVLAKAEGAIVPLRIIPRSTLLTLAGHFAPATDEQLIALGQRRKRLAGQGSIIRLVFRPDKGRRYHLYGLGLLILYILTDVRLYALPGVVCLTMAVMCRRGCRQQELL
jgi:hypothetical protein